MSLREAIFLPLANHLPRFSVFDEHRHVLLRLAGMNILGPCTIWGPLTIRPIGGAKNITVGRDTFINTETRFGCPQAPVIIGERVQIGPRVSFETVNHDLVYVAGKGRGVSSEGIVVEDEVWIGAGVTVLQGVTIGKGSVVCAGAVVNQDVESYTVVGGVPARAIKGTLLESGT
jgi:maltose O-acetyltransferase